MGSGLGWNLGCGEDFMIREGTVLMKDKNDIIKQFQSKTEEPLSKGTSYFQIEDEPNRSKEEVNLNVWWVKRNYSKFETAKSYEKYSNYYIEKSSKLYVFL